jgi:hypothetical protein
VMTDADGDRRLAGQAVAAAVGSTPVPLSGA